MRRKQVAVIGAGLGGISAAISLAQEGYAVSVYEKNSHIGGKLNQLKAQGYTFDLGPSILTMPHYFEPLFTRSGRELADYIPIRPVRPHWRGFFEDGTVINLSPEPAEMHAEAERISRGSSAQLEAFLTYAEKQYELIESGYFRQGLDTVREFQRFYGLQPFMKFDFWHSMHGSVARYIKEPHFRDLFDFFVKYVGSSAYAAPGFMNCLPVIQFRYDLWYVDGGMYNIAEGLGRLMNELDIAVHLDCEVVEIEKSAGRVTGLRLKSGEGIAADIVVSNMEVVPAYRDLLGEPVRFIQKLEKRLEPACSGLVIDLGLDCKYDQLAHHNFFFSGNQRDHFSSVFRDKKLPADPTIYLVAASRSDASVAPEGCDCLKILPHIPYLNEKHSYTREEYLAFKEQILAKLERMGLADLWKHVVFEHVWTPVDIEANYYSNHGAIYGVVTDRFRNFAFKAPKQSRLYENLFFTGGSVNPGGGMPMVVLCGRHVARKVVEWDSKL